MADVSDPALQETVDQVRSDHSGYNWCALGYKDKTTIEVKGLGKGGHAELCEFCKDDQVFFCLLRLEDGDKESVRIKFVFITFVGEGVGGLARGRVGSHMSNVKPLFGQFNCEFRADTVNEMRMDIIKKKLKVAGGADYDTGANAGGYKSSGNIKEKALKAYQEKEKETTIAKPVFVTSALPSSTPVDLAGRPMVAAPSEALKNIKMDLPPATGDAKAAVPAISGAVKNRPTMKKTESASSKDEETVAAAPAVAAAKPAVAAAKPVPAASKPAVSAAKPAVSAAKPAVAATKPAVVAEKPVPVAAVEKLVVTEASADLDEELSDDPEERARIRAEKRKAKREEAARKAQAEVDAMLPSSSVSAVEEPAEPTPAPAKLQQKQQQQPPQEVEEPEQESEWTAEPEEEEEDSNARVTSPQQEQEPAVEEEQQPEPAKQEAGSKAKGKLLFDDDDDDDDEDDIFKSKPKNAVVAAALPARHPLDFDDDDDDAANNSNKDAENDDAADNSVYDKKEFDGVTFGALKQFLAKHGVLADFSGSPAELAELINAETSA